MQPEVSCIESTRAIQRLSSCQKGSHSAAGLPPVQRRLLRRRIADPGTSVPAAPARLRRKPEPPGQDVSAPGRLLRRRAPPPLGGGVLSPGPKPEACLGLQKLKPSREEPEPASRLIPHA